MDPVLIGLIILALIALAVAAGLLLRWRDHLKAKRDMARRLAAPRVRVTLHKIGRAHV